MAVEMEVRDRILHITVQGAWTREAAVQTQRDAKTIVDRDDIFGLLVDLREADMQSSTLDVHAITSSHAQYFPPHVRHAVLVPAQTQMQADTAFAEDVASNRGIPLRGFIREAAALAWLREGRTEAP